MVIIFQDSVQQSHDIYGAIRYIDRKSLYVYTGYEKENKKKEYNGAIVHSSGHPIA